MDGTSAGSTSPNLVALDAVPISSNTCPMGGSDGERFSSRKEMSDRSDKPIERMIRNTANHLSSSFSAPPAQQAPAQPSQGPQSASCKQTGLFWRECAQAVAVVSRHRYQKLASGDVDADGKGLHPANLDIL